MTCGIKKKWSFKTGDLLKEVKFIWNINQSSVLKGYLFIPPLIERGLYCNHLVRPSFVHPSVSPSVHLSVRRLINRSDRMSRFDCTCTWENTYMLKSGLPKFKSSNCFTNNLIWYAFTTIHVFHMYNILLWIRESSPLSAASSEHMHHWTTIVI
jgi:hypothetical protein